MRLENRALRSFRWLSWALGVHTLNNGFRVATSWLFTLTHAYHHERPHWWGALREHRRPKSFGFEKATNFWHASLWATLPNALDANDTQLVTLNDYLLPRGSGWRNEAFKLILPSTFQLSQNCPLTRTALPYTSGISNSASKTVKVLGFRLNNALSPSAPTQFAFISFRWHWRDHT